ncbi:MAG: patatin family protein [Erysipelotrichaceae bacterium]|nr:patatin family protein [Erysipelotrichaceae bacterium]
MKTALVLEGGGLRGVFSAGVIDCFLDHDIRFDYVIGVSAGACNAMAILGKQKRYFWSIINTVSGRNSFYGVSQMVDSHRFVNLDKIFYEYTEQFHFDFDTLMNNPAEWEMVVSNIETGKAEYMTTRDLDRLRVIGKASCSLPIITDPVNIDGQLYLDGGICDSIPIEHVLEKGFDRIVVVLTRKKGNYSHTNEPTKAIIRRIYSAYPNLIKAMYDRGDLYRNEVAMCEQLEQEGKVILIRPTMKEIGRLESDENEISLSYFHGYTKAKENIETIKKWV